MINVKFIRNIVEKVTNLNLDEGNRKRDYSDARAMYYKICRDMTNETVQAIGVEVGEIMQQLFTVLKTCFQ